MSLIDALNRPLKACVEQGAAIGCKCLERSRKELRAEDNRVRLSVIPLYSKTWYSICNDGGWVKDFKHSQN